MFTHQKLKVYVKAVAFATAAGKLAAAWGRRHAIADQLRRASESIVVNIAEGARLISGQAKVRTLDYSIGSTLECAACLDIAAASAVKAAAYLDLCREGGGAPVDVTPGIDLLGRVTAMFGKF